MALFKSQVLTQASGSVGGLTYTRTNSGMVIRARSKPINPRSERQQVVRNAVGQLSTRWVEILTEQQREDWNTYGKQTTVLNRLGDAINLPGVSNYIRSNTPRIQAGLAIVDDAPTIYDHGEPLISPELTWMDPEGPLFLGWEAATGETGTVLIYLSRQQNPSINFFKGPYRYNVSAANTTTGEELVTPVNIQPGNRLFVRARVSYDDGRLSPITELMTVIPTPPGP